MITQRIIPILLMGLTFASAPVHAQESLYRHGMLTCRTSPSIGLVVGSRQRLACQFKLSTGAIQNYYGAITRVGLDVGITAGGIMSWAVLAKTSTIPQGALTGRFVGASGDISLGVGVGANVLVGGTHRTVSLQPLSVEGQVGLNLALGVAGLTLQPVH